AFSTLGSAIVRFTRLRLDAGDSAALNDYAAWVRTVRPADESHSFRDVLGPMWQNPAHQAVAAEAAAVFNDKHSPSTMRFLLAFNTRDWLDTPRVGLPGFRKRLLVELADTSPAGKLKLNAEGYGFMEVTNAYSGGEAIHTAGDPLAPKPGAELTFRVCDYYAFHLSRLDGAPRCELYWPPARRAKALAASAALPQQHGRP